MNETMIRRLALAADRLHPRTRMVSDRVRIVTVARSVRRQRDEGGAFVGQIGVADRRALGRSGNQDGRIVIRIHRGRA